MPALKGGGHLDWYPNPNPNQPALKGGGRLDWYRALGLNDRATGRDIMAAYRKLALKFHPDKHVALADGKDKQDLIRRFKVGSKTT